METAAPRRTATLWKEFDHNARIGYIEGAEYDKFMASEEFVRTLIQRDTNGHEHWAVGLSSQRRCKKAKRPAASA